MGLVIAVAELRCRYNRLAANARDPADSEIEDINNMEWKFISN